MPAVKVFTGLHEALAVANSEQPAPRVHINGHTYVPQASVQEAFETLGECFDYFDNKSDVSDGDDGVPEANEEMRLAQIVHETMLKLEGKS